MSDDLERDFDVEEVKDDLSVGEAVENIPTINDPEWSDYVLSQLSPDEKHLIKDKEYPKVDGLRRLVGKLIGPIVENKTKVRVRDGLVYATVRISVESYEDRYKTFEGSADATRDNVMFPYDKHLVAIAETRAEGRALRKMLNLRVQVFEEVNGDSELTSEESGPKYITDSQLTACDTVAKRANVNLSKMLEANGLGLEGIKRISYADAQEFFKKLSGYQNGNVPEELKGYVSDWK